jgi:hypothetical protein
VLSLRCPVLLNLATTEAVNHRFDKRLFKTARGFGMSKNSSGVFR